MNSILLILAISLTTQTSLANDGYSAIGAGGIVFKKSNKIAMQSEVLTISESNINVKYEFINNIDELEKKEFGKALVAFPIPELSCGYWGKPKVPEDFTVLVDGKKVNYNKEVKAFKGDKDVTDQIKKAGLPVDCRELESNAKLFKKAQKAKWASDDQGDPTEVHYTTRITYYWEQEFAPKQVVKIEHSYTPVLGLDSGHPAWFFNQAPHWDRDPKVRDLKNSDVNGGKSVNYILTTANTWSSDGIQQFKLIIKRTNPETFVGSTLGPLRAIDKNTFEFNAKHFAPDRNLTVFFGKAK